MKEDKRREGGAKILLFISILFILTSAGIRVFGLRFSEALLLSFFISLLSLPYLKRLCRRNFLPKIKLRYSRVNEAFLLILIYFLSTVVLFLKVVWMKNLTTFDEPIHLAITEAASSFNFQELVGALDPGKFGAYLRFGNPNPPFRYLFLAFLLKPFGITLFNGRLILSLISAFVPVSVYFLFKEVGYKGFLPMILSLSFVFTALSQSLFYLFLFDGMSTLFFTASLIFFLRSLRYHDFMNSLASGLLWSLCALTKYPPSTWLIIGYIIVLTLSIRRDKRFLNNVPPLILGIVLFFSLNAPIMPMQASIIKNVIATWSIELWTISDTPRILFWDLSIIFGWSPLIANAYFFRDCLKTRNSSLLYSIIMILGVVTVLILPQTRRIVQLTPLFFVYTINYCAKEYPKVVFWMVWLNFIWWGLLGFIPNILRF